MKRPIKREESSVIFKMLNCSFIRISKSEKKNKEMSSAYFNLRNLNKIENARRESRIEKTMVFIPEGGIRKNISKRGMVKIKVKIEVK